MANWANVASLGDPSSEDWQGSNLTWIEPIKGQRWQVYKPAAAAFEGLLNDLINLGYHPTSSGGYNYRNIRGGDQLSQHAFGTAIDLNAMTNAMGQSASDIPHAAELARKWGLEWGGNWKNRPDPMHFEYTGADTGAQQVQGPAAPPQDPQQAFVYNMWPLAVAQSKRTGVDPRIIIAQAAQETSWGKSVHNNNYFNIKGSATNPGTQRQTLEFTGGRMQPMDQSFRDYKGPHESFEDYGSFMLGDRYKAMREAKGLEAQVAALNASGYATDPAYGAAVLKIAQGIPESGYGAVGGSTGAGPGRGASPGGPVVTSPATADAGGNPYLDALRNKPEARKKNALEVFGEGIADSASAMAKAGQGFGYQVPQQPGPARVDVVPQSIVDPQQSEMRRQMLAMAMQRLNSGSLV